MKNTTITATELAKKMGVAKNTVTKLIREGMPCIYFGAITESRKGSRPRFELAKVMKWLEERSQKGGAE